MKKQYKAKVSYTIILIVFVFFAPFIQKIQVLNLTSKMLVTIGLFLLLFGFILFLLFTTRYTIDKNKLIIRVGFYSYKPIDISTIKEISKTRSIMASPAPSLDRILIKYGDFDEIIISPENKFDFADNLTKINPNIKNNIM